MPPKLPQLTHTRRRFLGTAALTMLAAHLGLTGSARAHTTTPGALPAQEESAMTTTQSAATQGTATIRPFRVDIPQADLNELRGRIAATRWSTKEPVPDASQGVQLATLQALMRYWGADYDFGRLAARLNALPQFMTEIDGVDIHFIHVKSRHENALPLLITHGWPGSIIEMLGAIGPLTDPTAHGGTAADAFDVVIPSVPGYGFSAQPAGLGWNPGRVAVAWGVLMERLGYSRYVAQGGDVGAVISDVMARLAPKGLLGVHFNFLVAFPPEVVAAVFGGAPAPAGMSPQEQATLAAVGATFRRGYIVEMSEHPQTIGSALTDSPIGLAAWMLDHDTDSYEKIARAFLDGRPTGGLTRESVVDNIALYWLTNTATSTARSYWENQRATLAAVASGQAPPGVSLPVGFTVFPGELYQAPRTWLEKVYPKLMYFNEVDKGGHFAAWEEPELFTTEARAAFRSLR